MDTTLLVSALLLLLNVVCTYIFGKWSYGVITDSDPIDTSKQTFARWIFGILFALLSIDALLDVVQLTVYLGKQL